MSLDYAQSGHLRVVATLYLLPRGRAICALMSGGSTLQAVNSAITTEKLSATIAN